MIRLHGTHEKVGSLKDTVLQTFPYSAEHAQFFGYHFEKEVPGKQSQRTALDIYADAMKRIGEGDEYHAKHIHAMYRGIRDIADGNTFTPNQRNDWMKTHAEIYAVSKHADNPERCITEHNKYVKQRDTARQPASQGL